MKKFESMKLDKFKGETDSFKKVLGGTLPLPGTVYIPSKISGFFDTIADDCDYVTKDDLVQK